MRRHRNVKVRTLAAICAVAGMSIVASAAEVKGMIYSRTGETLIVKSDTGNVTVVLTDSTKTKDDRGILGLREEQMSSVVLIPGLKVDVDGTSDDQGRIIATKITVDGDDLETSEMIQAGLHPTAEQVAANLRAIEANRKDIATNQGGIATNQRDISSLKEKLDQQNAANRANREDIAAMQQNIKEIQTVNDRFAALSEYDVKGEATVKFGVGSSTISPEDEEQLKKLAETASGITGFIVEVMGYADSSGDALMNEKLSEDRAKRVISFLIQQGNIPVRHIVAPGAMGEYQPAASNETPEGRAENRRVEVKILVNKAIAGK